MGNSRDILYHTANLTTRLFPTTYENDRRTLSRRNLKCGREFPIISVI